MEDITFLIKTFERPKHLNKLIESILEFYPEVPIIVVDDSKVPVIRKDVEYHTMPYDSGVVAGRNLLMKKCKTKYFSLLDDDFVFTEETKIEILLDILKRNKLDIMAGGVRESGNLIDYYGTLEREDDTVYYRRDVIDKGEYSKADIVPFFFVGTGDLKGDPYFKTTEHFDFFYSLKGKKEIGFTKEVIVNHERESFPSGEKYRHKRWDRRKEFLTYMLEKHNIKKLVSFNETVT